MGQTFSHLYVVHVSLNQNLNITSLATSRGHHASSTTELGRRVITLISITQLMDYCKSCILIGYATRELIVIVTE